MPSSPPGSTQSSLPHSHHPHPRSSTEDARHRGALDCAPCAANASTACRSPDNAISLRFCAITSTITMLTARTDHSDNMRPLVALPRAPWRSAAGHHGWPREQRHPVDVGIDRVAHRLATETASCGSRRARTHHRRVPNSLVTVSGESRTDGPDNLHAVNSIWTRCSAGVNSITTMGSDSPSVEETRNTPKHRLRCSERRTFWCHRRPRRRSACALSPR